MTDGSGRKARGTGRRTAVRLAVSTAVAAVLAVAVLDHAGLWWVVVTWWRGELSGGTRLWGLPVRVWGRLGKAMEFVAGAAVVLELIGPARFRAWSARWRRRRKQALDGVERLVAAYPLEALREAMKRSVVVEEEVLYPMEAAPPPRMVPATGGAPRADATGAVAQPELDAWHAATVAALPDAHDCGHPHGWQGGEVCRQQVAFVSAQADEFLRARLSPADWRRLSTAGPRTLAVRSGFMWFLGTVLMTPMIGVVIFLMRDVGAGRQRLSSAAFGGLALCFFSGFLALCVIAASGEVPGRSRAGRRFFRAVLWIRTVPPASLMRLTAVVLDRARPSHTIEWFAFWTFVVGFGLDFLSS